MIVKANQEGFKELLEGVRLKNMVHGERTHLTQIKLEQGAVIPEHQHPHEQTGFMLSGRLRFFGEGGETIVTPGDCWKFASGEAHGAEALEDSVVLELFSPLREDYLDLEN